jgi:N-methylhydantoinase B
VVEGCELRPDSAGIGRFRGFPGYTIRYRALKPLAASYLLDRTKVGAYGVHGGASGKVNVGRLHVGADAQEYAKAAMVPVPPGGVVELSLGGGGGYGPPAERDPAAVHSDIREGYISEQAARHDYPHAFELSGNAAADARHAGPEDAPARDSQGGGVSAISPSSRRSASESK